MWIRETVRYYLRYKIKICNKLNCTIRHLSVHLPRKSLLLIYKSFVQPYLDYSDIIHDNLVIESLINKLEKVQYQACLTITSAIQGKSRKSLYKELGVESLQSRRWYKKMILFYKILNGLTPKYLRDCNGDWTHNYLVLKRTLDHLTKLGQLG